MKYKTLLILFSFISFIPAWAQEVAIPINMVYQSTMLGVGNSNVHDSYLSPLKYSGINLGLYHEQMKMTGLMNGNISAQHLFTLDFSSTDNDSETASDYAGFIGYSYGLHYRFQPVQKLQVFAGLQAAGMLGFVYNDRNGNNPATGKAHINLNLSGMAAYSWQIKSQPIHFRYQVDAPFIGILFSPEFGQSYYEISLGDDSNLVHFASFHNQVFLRNVLSVELPFNFMTLRLSYLNSIYETDVNHIKTRIHTNSFYIGFSRDFFSVPGKKKNKDIFKSVF